MTKNIEENKLMIAQVLASFKIGLDGDITYTTGPIVTLYEFYIQVGIRMSKVRGLKDEISAALHIPSVRVIAPTERGTVGIEVPNTERRNIPMIEMLYSPEYMNTTMELPLVLGKTIANEVFMADLVTMPHLLVAGATGMGKSVGLKAIITSLLNKLPPNELKLVLIDPKQVELSIYDTIAKPYLAHLPGMPSVCTTSEEARATLEAVIRLMEYRYTMLKNAGVRNLQDYNGMSGHESLPYYVVVIDEFGDLILQNKKMFESYICVIAQKGHSVGIHTVISTQHLTSKIITNNIKTNFSARIAFRTPTGKESRVILDRVGAEELTGEGDMLFSSNLGLARILCAYISTNDVNEMCHEMAEEWSDASETLLPVAPKPKEPERIKIPDRILFGACSPAEMIRWFNEH